MAELVLKENCFKFNGKFYKQIGGTMIGTQFGPEYSCLAVGKLEHDIKEAYDGPIPELFKRYIDDIIGGTSLTREELERFITFVSSFHPAFQFTFEVSEHSVSFLDINAFVEGDRIQTSVYYKPTDSHSYLTC